MYGLNPLRAALFPKQAFFRSLFSRATLIRVAISFPQMGKKLLTKGTALAVP